MSLSWVQLIIYVFLLSTLIYFSPGEGEILYQIYLKATKMGEWGLTTREKMVPGNSHSHTEVLHFLPAVEGGGMWVSNGLLVWSILTLVVACRITVLVFEARRHICAMSVGGYCRL